MEQVRQINVARDVVIDIHEQAAPRRPRSNYEPVIQPQREAAAQVPCAQRVHGRIYTAAKAYAETVDTGLSVTKAVVKGTLECTRAATSTMIDAYTMGPKGSAKAFAVWSFGGNNFSDALESIQKRDDFVSTQRFKDKNRQPVLLSRVIQDQRTFPERLGEAAGNVGLGAAKAAASTTATVMTAAYAVGTVSNAINLQSSLLSLHAASKALAFGVNTFGSMALSAAGASAEVAASVTGHVISSVAGSPMAYGRVAVAAAGIGTGLYIAAQGYVKASNADGIMGKIKGGARVAAGLTLAVAAPILTYTNAAASAFACSN